MTKYLLGTTAVLGAIFAVSTASAAEQANPTPTMGVPALTISGQAAFNMWFSNQNVKDKTTGTDGTKDQRYGSQSLATVDNARLKFSVAGKTDVGMDYGFVTVFDLDQSKDKNIREAYVFFGGSWGTTYLGDAEGVEKTMAYGGFDPLVATGGFDGDFDRVVNFTSFDVHSVDLNGTTKRSTKATYITPQWRGLQAGISFTPKQFHKGSQELNTRTSNSDPKEPFSRNNIALGANFDHKFQNGFDFGLSGTAIFGKVKAPFITSANQEFHNVRSFAVGTLMKWKGVEFGFEYGHNGKGGIPDVASTVGANAGQFVDFGLGYTWGATKMSAGYFYGWRKALTAAAVTAKSKTNIFTLGVEHKLAPGLAVYGEYAHYNMKNPGAAFETAQFNTLADLSGEDVLNPVGNNKANAFVLGTKIKF